MLMGRLDIPLERSTMTAVLSVFTVSSHLSNHADTVSTSSCNLVDRRSKDFSTAYSDVSSANKFVADGGLVSEAVDGEQDGMSFT